ncbi:unnamed protein product, partial [Amoebophrya sp. A120]
ENTGDSGAFDGSKGPPYPSDTYKSAEYGYAHIGDGKLPIEEDEWRKAHPRSWKAGDFFMADKNQDNEIDVEVQDELLALQEEQHGLDSNQALHIGIDGLTRAQKDALHLGPAQTLDED